MADQDLVRSLQIQVHDLQEQVQRLQSELKTKDERIKQQQLIIDRLREHSTTDLMFGRPRSPTVLGLKMSESSQAIMQTSYAHIEVDSVCVHKANALKYK